MWSLFKLVAAQRSSSHFTAIKIIKITNQKINFYAYFHKVEIIAFWRCEVTLSIKKL